MDAYGPRNFTYFTLAILRAVTAMDHIPAKDNLHEALSFWLIMIVNKILMQYSQFKAFRV